jgi:uncharacterized cupin superfamily protein
MSGSAAPRRIVTGTNAGGESYLARVEEVQQVDYPTVLPPTPASFDSSHTAPALGATHGEGASHNGFYRIWGTDWLPVPLPTDGRAPYFDFGPSADETPAALRQASILPPPLGMRIGLGISAASSVPGRLHWTDSTDVLFVISGKHGQIVDDGEILLHPGDVLVQNGTMHSHQSTEPVVLGYVVVSAMRTAPSPPIELMNPVSGSPAPYRGGYRSPELAHKTPMPAWQVPGATPRPYPLDGSLPDRIEDLVAPRRVVTGTNPDGRSYFARVESIDEIDYAAAGVSRSDSEQIWRIWQSDRLPNLLPDDGLAVPLASRPAPADTVDALRRAPLMPTPLGMVVTTRRILPTEAPSALRRTDSLDAVFVMGGELTMTTESGEEVLLTTNDVVIQNGTAHAWHNRGDRPAILGVASFGAAHIHSVAAAQTAGAAVGAAS